MSTVLTPHAMNWIDHAGSTAPACQCSNCGEHVSQDFVRVYGDNDGEVYGCLSCLTTRDLRKGNHLRGERAHGSI